MSARSVGSTTVPRNVLQAECEVPVETDVQRPLADDVPPSEDLEWAWPVRRKLQDLRGGMHVLEAPVSSNAGKAVMVDGGELAASVPALATPTLTSGPLAG